jgi:tetratricopeptide (TPR) repeat protein
MPWPFSKPKKKSKAQILNWAQEQMEKGISRQDICTQLLNIDRSKMSVEEMQAYSEAEHDLFGVMVNRNLLGESLEKEGRTDEAINLYEQNVMDKFIGTHPYERLRIVYTKRKDFENAIRICQAYIKLPHQNNGKKTKFEDYLKKLLEKKG